MELSRNDGDWYSNARLVCISLLGRGGANTLLCCVLINLCGKVVNFLKCLQQHSKDRGLQEKFVYFQGQACFHTVGEADDTEKLLDSIHPLFLWQEKSHINDTCSDGAAVCLSAMVPNDTKYDRPLHYFLHLVEGRCPRYWGIKTIAEPCLAWDVLCCPVCAYANRSVNN